MSSMKSKNDLVKTQNSPANKKIDNRESKRESDGESIWRGMLNSNIELAAKALLAAADDSNFDYDFESIYAIIFPHGLRSLQF